MRSNVLPTWRLSNQLRRWSHWVVNSLEGGQSIENFFVNTLKMGGGKDRTFSPEQTFSNIFSSSVYLWLLTRLILFTS